MFVTLVHFDDCRWWTVNGWTMMLVMIVITVRSDYFCYLLMFVATIHVDVFLFNSHLKAFLRCIVDSQILIHCNSCSPGSVLFRYTPAVEVFSEPNGGFNKSKKNNFDRMAISFLLLVILSLYSTFTAIHEQSL